MKIYVTSRTVYSRVPKVLWHNCVGGPIDQKANRRPLGMLKVMGVAQRRTTLPEADKSKQGQSQHGHPEDRQQGIAAC